MVRLGLFDEHLKEVVLLNVVSLRASLPLILLLHDVKEVGELAEILWAFGYMTAFRVVAITALLSLHLLNDFGHSQGMLQLIRIRVAVDVHERVAQVTDAGHLLATALCNVHQEVFEELLGHMGHRVSVLSTVVDDVNAEHVNSYLERFPILQSLPPLLQHLIVRFHVVRLVLILAWHILIDLLKVELESQVLQGDLILAV